MSVDDKPQRRGWYCSSDGRSTAIRLARGLDQMRLLYSKVSPFARKVRVAAIELGVYDDLNLVEITEPTVPTNYIPELSVENPIGKVPVLVLGDGTTILDSNVIVEFLNDSVGGRLHGVGQGRWQALTLQALANGIIEAGIACRLEGLRPEGLRWSAWSTAHHRKLVAALDLIEARPGQLDGEFTCGQISLACAIEWLVFRGIYVDACAERPRLSAWLERVKERASLANTRPPLGS